MLAVVLVRLQRAAVGRTVHAKFQDGLHLCSAPSTAAVFIEPTPCQRTIVSRYSAPMLLPLVSLKAQLPHCYGGAVLSKSSHAASQVNVG